jgi:hypothetical protein
MSLSVLEQVATQEAGSREAEEQKWTELVVTVADETVTADEVVVALRKLGRDAAELEQAVGILRRRREWAVGVEAGRSAEAVLAACAGELAAAEAKLAAAVEKHEREIAPILRRRDEARGVLSQAWSAERELRATVSRTTRDKLLAGVVAEEQALASSREGLEKELRDLQRLVETAESFGESASSMDKARLPAAKQRLAALRRLLAESDDAAAALASKRAAVEREFLRPELW